MIENDLLIKHLRTLTKGALKSQADMSTVAANEIHQAAKWVEDNIGLEGQITEADQRTGRQPEVDDTLRSADTEHTAEGKEISDETYLPHLGVFAFSHHTAYKWGDNARKLGLTYSFKKDTNNLAISEDHILRMAAVINERRRMSEATNRIRAGKPLEPFAAKHPGTDARNTVEEGLHSPYKNWSDVEKSQSSICLTISNGSRYVNGSMSQHQSWVSIDIKNPDGRTLVKVAMSGEQFASFLIGRTMVPCTLDHYWSQGQGSVALRERVYNPEPVLARMKQRLRDSTAIQDKDFAEVIEEAVAHAATGKPMSKGKLEELIKSLKQVKQRRADNASFIIEQAIEEGSALAESAVLRVLMAQQVGGDVKETISGIGRSFRGNLIEKKP